MITFGYAVSTRSNEMGGREIQVRIPSVHGAYNLRDYKGATPRNYVQNKDLPWYLCLESVASPANGEVVALASTNAAGTAFIVIGTTGSTYVEVEAYN